MSILVDKNTRVVTQGITGRDRPVPRPGVQEYGTQIVAGVTPGKGGSELRGDPDLRHRRRRP